MQSDSGVESGHTDIKGATPMAKRRGSTITVDEAKNPAVPSQLKGATPIDSGRLAGLLFGDSGVGKTYAAIESMPAPYIFDTEAGTSHYGEMIRKANGAVVQTVDIDEVCTELRKLIRYDHPFKTVVIDPLTTLYDEALAVGERLVGTKWSAHYQYANRRMKEMMALLSRLDMHVIATSHEKDEWQDNQATGDKTIDGWKRTKYAFDLVMHMRIVGKKRMVEVKKSRLKGFPLGETFMWSSDELQSRLGGRWNDESQSGDIAPVERVERLRELIALRGVDDETVAKWLKKAKATDLDDMTSGTVERCITYLETETPTGD